MSKYLKTREGSLEDLAKQMQNKVLESDYQDKFKKELDKAGRPIGQMTGAEKKAFFNKLDKMHSAKNEQVKNPYAIGMAQAMKAKDDQPPLKKSTITKAHDIAKSIEKDQKEEVEIKEEDAYQNDRFAVSGNSAKIDNTNTRDKSNHIYAPNAKTAVAMYKAGIKSYKDTADMRKKFPMAVEEVQEAVFDVRLNVDGAVDTSSVNSVVKMLKDKGIMAKVQPSERDGQAVTINSSASKNRVINVLGNIVDEEVQETHSFVTNKQNEKQKKVGGEKDIVDPAPSIKKESLYDSIKSVWQISAEEMDKIKSEAKYYKKEQNKNDLKPKKIADTGSKSTPVDVEPKVEI